MWWIDPWLRIISVASLQSLHYNKNFPGFLCMMRSERCFSHSSWGNFLLSVQICNTCSVENGRLKSDRCTYAFVIWWFKNAKIHTAFLESFPREDFFFFKISTWLSPVHNSDAQAYIENSWHIGVTLSEGFCFLGFFFFSFSKEESTFVPTDGFLVEFQEDEKPSLHWQTLIILCILNLQCSNNSLS